MYFYFQSDYVDSAVVAKIIRQRKRFFDAKPEASETSNDPIY